MVHDSAQLDVRGSNRAICPIGTANARKSSARSTASTTPLPSRSAREGMAKGMAEAWRSHDPHRAQLRAKPWPAARPQHAHHRRRRARRHAKVHHWVAARPPPPPDQAPATAPIFVESLRSRRSGPLLTNINKSRSPSRSKSRSPQAAPLAVEPVEDAKAAPDALRRDLGERRCPPTHRR